MKMLGDKSYLNVKNGEKSAFLGELQESRFHEVLQEKEKEIVQLTKTIKRLKKEIKEKQQGTKLPTNFEGNNGLFKNLLQREVSRYNQLKEIVSDVTERIRKLSQQINCEFSIFQNSLEMENLVKMLESANVQGSNIGKSYTSQRSLSGQQDQEIFVEQAIDEFEVIIRGLMMKHGETSKLYKQSLQNQKQLQEELTSYKKDVKTEKKSKDLLQKLLQKNETEKNLIVNQINNIGNQQEIQQLRSKSKEEILLHYCKLNYRIKELQNEKQQYIRSTTRDKQKQVKLYQALLTQVKGIKERNRIGHSVA